MKRVLAMFALTGVLGACDGHQITPAMVGNAAMNMVSAIANAGKPKGVQVGWTYAQVVAYQGKPQRIYGHGGLVMVYPLPNNLQQKIGISGLDNNSTVQWVGVYDSLNRPVNPATGQPTS